MTQLPVELDEFFAAHDYSERTIEAVRYDVAKFVKHFTSVNNERLDVQRITTSDVSGFKNHLRDVQRQSVSTVNRALVSVRRFLDYLASVGKLSSNPAKGVKEIKRGVPLQPKSLSPAQINKVFREAELRGDLRAIACLKLMAMAGLRVSDVISLEIADVMLAPRSGHVVCRRGKGNKQRIVLCLRIMCQGEKKRRSYYRGVNPYIFIKSGVKKSPEQYFFYKRSNKDHREYNNCISHYHGFRKNRIKRNAGN